jgi:outer membrane protein TolC
MARIDSVEARITVQERAIALQTAQLELQQARLAFEVHLWADDGQPRQLQDNVVPGLPLEVAAPAATDQLLDLANTRHPELVKLQIKLDQLEVERRLSIENLKPAINLKYNYLSGPQGLSPDFSSNFSQHNYQFGVQALMPLFLRKERGKLGLTKVKITQGQLELVQQRRTILNEIKSAAVELTVFGQLLIRQQAMVINFQTLRDGEVDKFINGESSLFLVNTRESKLIEGRIKAASLQAKYQKARAYLRWAAGLGLE